MTLEEINVNDRADVASQKKTDVCKFCKEPITLDGEVWSSTDPDGNQHMWCPNGETQHEPWEKL